MKAVRIADRLLAEGHPAFIAAEVGINHNGDIGLAHRLIDAAATSGADAVKFQSYRTEDFVTDKALKHIYASREGRVVESQFEMFKRCELSPGNLAELAQHCRERGVVFFSTPTSAEGVRELVRLEAPLLKNGSDYLGHLPLIREMARTGLPTVISTGMATHDEIKDAVCTFCDAGGNELILLHCTSSYPTPPRETHLRRIPALAGEFGRPIGFSDHTDGVIAAIGAVAMGACFVEKHFTLDKSAPGPDHAFSANPQEFEELVQAIRSLEERLGDPAIGPTPSETQGRHSFRLSCVTAHDLACGHVLTESDVAFRRPGTGMPPKAIEQLVGRPLAQPVAAGQVLLEQHFTTAKG